MRAGPKGTAVFSETRRLSTSTSTTAAKAMVPTQEAREQLRHAEHQAQAHGQLEVAHAQGAVEDAVGDGQQGRGRDGGEHGAQVAVGDEHLGLVRQHRIEAQQQ